MLNQEKSAAPPCVLPYTYDSISYYSGNKDPHKKRRAEPRTKRSGVSSARCGGALTSLEDSQRARLGRLVLCIFPAGIISFIL
jgi:hypothetical protein